MSFWHDDTVLEVRLRIWRLQSPSLIMLAAAESSMHWKTSRIGSFIALVIGTLISEYEEKGEMGMRMRGLCNLKVREERETKLPCSCSLGYLYHYGITIKGVWKSKENWRDWFKMKCFYCKIIFHLLKDFSFNNIVRNVRLGADQTLEIMQIAVLLIICGTISQSVFFPK